MSMNKKGTPLYTTSELRAAVENGVLDASLEALIPVGGLAAEKSRILELISTFEATYGADRNVALLTVSGRSELSGNHTDHNHGCVIAASVNLEILAIASPTSDRVIRLTSAGFPEDTVDLAAYTQPSPDMYGTSASLIAGVSAGLAKEGYAVGGFDACTVSSVLTGSGLSSSAAFEDMVGTIQSHLYNNGEVDNVTIAKLAQYAENQFFGKPCGLMDQVACAVGGIVSIDFKDPSAPVITPVPFDMTAAGYRLCIVDTGGNHADLTADYASVPAEMKAVAKAFGKDVLRGLSEDDIVSNSLDTVPGNVVFLPPAEQSEKAARAIDHDGDYLPLRHPDLHISHATETAAVADVDDLLAPQIPNPALHGIPPLGPLYALRILSYSQSVYSAVPSGSSSRRNATPSWARASSRKQKKMPMSILFI